MLTLLIAFKLIHVNRHAVRRWVAGLTTLLGVALMFVGYGLSESDRSGLLVRTFDNNYIVKYLGLNEYAAYNIYKTQKTAEVKNRRRLKTLKRLRSLLNLITPFLMHNTMERLRERML
ncbi:Lipoteichoic acid synthase 1 [Weissella viridescens]|uniref:Lipoteichoic acid synthase 1 n=1 Tax=Weissella viridescens TaxID=1629 RepID=A0A380NWV8_WEIVI|nr:Lipoteichoic acid synthase 1 [Weissella viridescens]